jgi:pyruvate dehydrogenase E2 component (dihydrolipoamide acetyltransferase)
MFLKLPELGEGVHEGELVKWRVKEGDVVKDDQAICDIMTDKATIELPSPFSGKITKILAKEGQMVHVGQDMLEYEGKGGSATASPAAAAPAAAKPAAPAATASAPAAMTAAPSVSVQTSIATSVAAAPSTRRFARESGVEITQVPATGPHGRVMREDVERFVTGGGRGTSSNGAGAVSAGPGKSASSVPLKSLPARSHTVANTEERVPFKGLRKKISEKMRLSKDKAAHFTYVEEADATNLVELRNQAKEHAAQYGIKMTYLPFVLKAMVCALRKFPILNSTLDEQTQEIVYRNYYNIGLSIQTDDGLTAPNVKNVESKSILELAQEIQSLVERARAKRLSMDDLTGGTITLTNAGSIGGLFATPIVNFPEVAIVGLNKIERKPVVKKINGAEQIVIRDWTLFSISLDHRIVDGAIAAEFMKEMIRFIENPALMFLEG